MTEGNLFRSWLCITAINLALAFRHLVCVAGLIAVTGTALCGSCHNNIEATSINAMCRNELLLTSELLLCFFLMNKRLAHLFFLGTAAKTRKLFPDLDSKHSLVSFIHATLTSLFQNKCSPCDEVKLKLADKIFLSTL